MLGRADLIRSVLTFTGREEDIEEIEKLFLQNQTVILLNGLGGIGKTTVAKKYVTKNLESKKYDHICWIDYQISLQESFISQIDHTYNVRKNEHEIIYKKIISDLNNFEGNNLLIIDGFDDGKDGENIKTLPSYFKSLITSRNYIHSDNIKIHKLNTLSPKIAKKLFYKYLYNFQDTIEEEQELEILTHNENKDLDELLENIGYHTLTIEIMAKTLAKDERLSIKDLLNLKGKIHVYTNHPKAAVIALEEFLTKLFDLIGISTKHISILQNLSILPSIDIPQTDILDFLQINDDDRSEYIDLLHELADRGWLIKTNKLENNRHINYFRCHQIIQAFIKNHKIYKPTFEKCRDCINYFILKLKVKPGENPLFKAILVLYATSILENIHEEKHEIALLANNVAVVYKAMGDYAKALKYALRALQINEKILNTNDLKLANLYNNIGIFYRFMGNFHQALEYSKKALVINEKKLKHNHPEMAITFENMAEIYRDMGDIPHAIEYENKALEIREKILDPDHPDLATTYHETAMIYQDLGKYNQALEFSQKSMRIRKKVLDADHPDLATSYIITSWLYRNLGNFSLAMEYIQKALMIREKVLDVNHPDIATTYHDLAFIYKDMGKPSQALELATKALKIREEVLNALHPVLAYSFNDIAPIYQDLGDLEKALEYAQKGLSIREQIHDADHPELATSYKNIADIFSKKNDYDKAKLYIIKSVVMYQKLFPNGHPDLKRAKLLQEDIERKLK